MNHYRTGSACDALRKIKILGQGNGLAARIDKLTEFSFHSEPLQDTWLDAYGHLNEAYYLVPFSNANWAMQEHFGIGIPYFEQTGCAIYTLETHLRYLSEVRSPAELQVRTMIVANDAKRIWCAHKLVVNDTLCATAEIMMLHYSTRENRSAVMPDEVQQQLTQAVPETPPDWVGAQLSLSRK